MPRRTTSRHSEEWWLVHAPPTAVRCEARYKSGEPCGREAIAGATVCGMHGGAAPQVRARAAARIGNAADEMVKRLFAMLDEPETPHAVRAKIMQDILDRAGLNAVEKHMIGVGELDPVEKLFRDLLADPSGLAGPTPETYLPSPEFAALNRGADAQELLDDVVDAELVEDTDTEPPHSVRLAGKPSEQPPAQIRRDLERLGLL